MSEFDVAVDGFEDTSGKTLAEGLHEAKVLCKNRKVLQAQQILEEWAEVNAYEAILALAKFYKRVTLDDASHEQCLCRSEKLLLTLDQRGVKDAEVYYELADVYRLLGKPISALGYLFQARRTGMQIAMETVYQYQKAFVDVIDDLASDWHGCAVLGCAYLELDDAEEGIKFLETAVEAGDPQGIYARMLSDIYGAKPSCLAHQKLSYKYERIAASRGNPDFVERR